MKQEKKENEEEEEEDGEREENDKEEEEEDDEEEGDGEGEGEKDPSLAKSPRDDERAIQKLGEWIRDQQTMEETATILQQQGWMVQV